MKKITSIIIAFTLLINLHAFDKVIISARKKALDNAYHAFSDDGAGICANPALIGYAKNLEFSLSHGTLFFYNNIESFSILIPAQQLTYSVNLDIIHDYLTPISSSPNISFSENSDTGILRSIDYSVDGGISYRIMKNLLLGTSLSFIIQQIDTYKYFQSALRAGCAYELNVIDNIGLILGMSIEKDLIGNTTDNSIGLESGFKSDLSFRGVFSKIKTEVGISFLYNVNSFDSFSKLGEQFAAAGENNLQIGIAAEAFKNSYFTPRISLGMQGLSFNNFNTSFGFGTGIQARGMRYEFNLALSKVFTSDTILSGLNYFATLTIKRLGGAFSYIKKNIVLFDKQVTSFYELYTVPKYSWKENTGSSFNTIPIKVENIKGDKKNKYTKSMIENADHLFKNILYSKPFISKDKESDFIIRPSLKITGELMTLQIKLLDKAGHAIFSEEYTEEFTEPDEILENVERVRFYTRNNKLRIIESTEPSVVKKNNNTISSVINLYKKELISFINKNYLKKILISANKKDTEIRINDKFAGYYTGDPVETLLKPGNYTLKAVKKGFKETLKIIEVKEESEVTLMISDDKYLVDVYTSFLGKGNAVEASIGKDKSVIKNKYIFANVTSDLKELSINGFYNIKKVPLNIKSSMNYNLNFLRNFSGKPQATEIWRMTIINDEYDILFTKEGINFQGVNTGDRIMGKGLYSIPFYINDFEIEIFFTRSGQGHFNFAIMSEENKKITINNNNKFLSVVSEYKDISKNINKAGKVRAKEIISKNIRIKTVKRGRNIRIIRNDSLIYEGNFMQHGNIRFFIGVDSDIENEKINFTVKEINFKHL